MAKKDQYVYEGDGVNLSFSFPIGPDNMKQKIAFLTLLHQALEEIQAEVDMHNKQNPS